MPKPIGHESRYNAALDGLRTVAVFGVIFYHMNVGFMAGGLLGVAVFFTISGYLITGNLMRSWDAHRNLGLKTFWLRRFRRLMPAVIVTVVSTVFLTAWLTPDKLSEYSGSAWSSIFYYNNWYTIVTGDSYFDQFTTTPYDHIWSLSVEEQFYLIWPLLLLGLLVFFQGNRTSVTLVTTVLTLGSFGLMWALFAHGADLTRIYEGTDTRAGGLLAGAALAVFTSTHTRVASRVVSELIGWVGLVSILALFVLVPHNDPFLYRGGILVLTVVAVGVLVGIRNKKTVLYRLLGSKPMAWLGERSYGIYLWHMPIIAFLVVPLRSLPLWVATLIVIALSVFIASMSWTLIEDPIRRHGLIVPLWAWVRGRVHMPQPVWSVVATMALAVLLIGIPGVVTKPAPTPPSSVSAAPSATGTATATATRCEQVVHIGDSTSLMMFDDAGVYTPFDNAEQTYRAAGATTVINSSFGARATNLGWQGGPTGLDSVNEILGTGVPERTCFIIALGTNNAANQNRAGYDNSVADISAVMDAIGPNYPVLWVTPVTDDLWAPQYYQNAAMEVFNAGLYTAQESYPNLWVYPWNQEVREEWFLDGDGVHYNTDGNTARAHHFARALIDAFPQDPTSADPSPLLPNPPLPATERLASGL